MGTDIHGVVQTRWYGRPEWFSERNVGFEDDRNYRLFAALADVRNGTGFAGVYTHDPIQVIAEPRGVPADFEYKSLWWIEDSEDREWVLGDHSYSWLTLEEVRLWPGWDQELTEGGYISREQYGAYQKTGELPRSWSGDVWGSGVVKANAEESYFPDGWNEVFLRWHRPLRECVNSFLAWTDYLAVKYPSDRNEVRLVFGFDS